MRIVIDLQGAQTTASRSRGIGRYSLALTQALARLADHHEVWIALNSLFPETIEPMRAAFDGLVPQERIVVWQVPGPVAEIRPDNRWRQGVAERLREAFLAALKPDVIHVSSLFEGFEDDAVTVIGARDGVPTSMTLYDLIPLIHRDLYLKNPRQASWYERKLRSLRSARLWLAISESSRQEAIARLNLPEEWVVNVSAAADAMFQPMRLTSEQAQEMLRRYRVTRLFVMYTGGIDHRKNIAGLIRAYAALPAELRARHQLAIVCSASPAQIDHLVRLAAQCGLEGDELVVTGFVPDADLVALYNLCAAFAFPSWHEGFGLPALEAMACGAAVIGAATSSVPEVIGRPDAMFDPHDEHDMTAKLHAVLTNDSFREELKRHGLKRAKRFSWDNSARCALEAFERLYACTRAAQDPVASVSLACRPRLACVSPLPPEQSGIADYTAELLPELARHYEIDVIVDQPDVSDPWIRANCPIRSAAWFARNAHRYDRVLYHVGNSVFHQHMFGLLARHPGTVVLHDFFLSGIIAHLEESGYLSDAWTAALYASHGYHAVKERVTEHQQADVVWKYPANFAVLQQADGVITHSDYCLTLADRWYGDGYHADWAHIPQLRALPETVERTASRAALGLQEEDVLICCFGMLGPTKLNHRLLAAWLASPLAKDPRCHLVFVGKQHGGEYGSQLSYAMADSIGVERVRITGVVSPSLYRHYLAAADAAVQLRARSRGETSRTILDCMAYGLATIINAHGAAVEFPQDCALQLPDQFSDEALQAALAQVRHDPVVRRALGERARDYVRVRHDPRRVADQYRDAIERFARSGPQTIKATVIESIASLGGSPEDRREWVAVAQAVAANHAPGGGLKQILVDISELVRSDPKPGIQRVGRSVLDGLLADPPEGYRIEPVYASDDGRYRYARRFTMAVLGCPREGWADEPIEAVNGDVYLGVDRGPHPLPRCDALYATFRQRGVGVWFLVHDRLPLNRPDGFFDGAHEDVSRWLSRICEQGDGLVCVSRSAADELIEWLNQAQPGRQQPLKIGWFHLGTDMNVAARTDEIESGFDVLPYRTRRESTRQLLDVVLNGRWYRQWMPDSGGRLPRD